jgi:hypothetical protein
VKYTCECACEWDLLKSVDPIGIQNFICIFLNGSAHCFVPAGHTKRYKAGYMILWNLRLTILKDLLEQSFPEG